MGAAASMSRASCTGGNDALVSAQSCFCKCIWRWQHFLLVRGAPRAWKGEQLSGKPKAPLCPMCMGECELPHRATCGHTYCMDCYYELTDPYESIVLGTTCLCCTMILMPPADSLGLRLFKARVKGTF